MILKYATAMNSEIKVFQFKDLSHISVDPDWECEFCDESLEIPFHISGIISTAKLEAKLSKTVVLKEKTDTSIIDGIIIEYNNKRIDK